jgi:hypothetical protein
MTGNDLMVLNTSLADPKLREQTLIEINRGILNSFYTFKLGAPLKNYILKKKLCIRESYTLVEILTILKEIIRDEEMFDMRNPAIILCDKDLERTLNMRALHVSEIRDLVVSQLMRLKTNINKLSNKPLYNKTNYCQHHLCQTNYCQHHLCQPINRQLFLTI